MKIKNRVLLITKSKNFLRWLVVTALFSLLIGLHMGPSFTNSSNVILGNPGDHTAGIMYSSWVSGNKPLGDFSNMTNYPYGEDLFQPVSFTSIIPTGSHLLLSKATNIVRAWNILVFISYLSGALAMFGLVYMLTKNTYVGIFAAYAVSFTPYHAFSSHGQIAGLLNAGFVLALWQYLRLLQKPTLNGGIVLGSLIGINFYLDGYFVLFGMVLLLSFWVSLFILYRRTRSKKKTRPKKEHLKALIIATIISFIFLLPLLWVRGHYQERIDSFLGGTRSTIKQDAQTFSAEPYMYFLPQTASPLGGQISQQIQSSVFKKDSSPGLLFLGLIVSALALYTSFIFWSKRKSFTPIQSYAIICGVTLLIISFAMSLKPYFYFGNIEVRAPSALIIQLTSSWRVFGRLYVLVAIATVLLAALGLETLMKKWQRYATFVFGFIMILTAVELQSFYIPSQKAQFDFRSVPEVYHWLNKESDIGGVAEYPLDEPPQGRFLSQYYTYQTISNKPLLNSIRPDSENSGLRRSIAGVNDPQTLPVLRALNIDIINLRPSFFGATLSNQDVTRIFTYRNELEEDNSINSYRIEPGIHATYALVFPQLQYFQFTTSDSYETTYSLGQNTKLRTYALPNTTTKNFVEVSFNLTSIGRPRNITVTQNGVVLWSGLVDLDERHIEFNAGTARIMTMEIEDTPEEKDRLLIQLRKPQVAE